MKPTYKIRKKKKGWVNMSKKVKFMLLLAAAILTGEYDD